jgi:CPA2 family monovalent cation:H+ antiporter-2
MMLTPIIAYIAYRIRTSQDGQDLSPLGPAARYVDSIDGHVLLAGYGRMGRLLRDMLAKQYIPVIAIDTDDHVEPYVKTAVLRGDATQPAMLLKAGLKRAIAVAVLIDKPEDAKNVVKMVRALSPGMLIVARARDTAHAAALYQLGATATIPDVIEGSLHVAQELMTHIGIPEDAARQIIDYQRAHEAHAIETAKGA